MGTDGRAGGPAYDFSASANFAVHNLQPEVRAAVALFAELSIPLHAGVAGGPGNHLLSS